MGLTKGIGLIIAVVVVGGIGWYGVSQYMSAPTNDAMVKQSDSISGASQINEKDSAGVISNGREDAMMKDSTVRSGATMEDNSAMKQVGTYEAYSLEKLTLAKTGKVVLFFHADWCPVCRVIESEINSSATKIPDGVHILKVNYDTAIALRQKYGVTVQHTFVRVDASGVALQKFNDARSLSEVLARLK